MAKETIILDFQINAKEALDNITKAREALITLREEQKALQKEIKEGTATDDMKKRFGELAVEIKELTGVINVNNRELQNQIKAQQSAQGSLESYRAQLKNLKQAYSELSEEERNGAKGKDMIEKMDSLTNSAKAAELQLQGVPAGLSKTVAAMQQVSPVAGGVTAAISKVGKAFKALMANPYALAIAAIITVVKKLTDSFKKNDEAMTALQKAMAPLKAVLEVIEKAFQKIIDVVVNVISAIGNFVKKLVSMIPFMSEYVNAQEEIVESTDNLQEAEREYAINSAKRQKEISELRNKATQSEKYSLKERRKFLEEALEKERYDTEVKKDLAIQKLKLTKKQYANEKGYTELTAELYDKLSDEQKDTLTELQVAVENTEKEFNEHTRKMTSQLNSFNKAAIDGAKERAKTEKQVYRELEDLQIRAMKNFREQEEAMTRISYQRQIEDIRERLRNEKGLTKNTREYLNEEIIQLEAELQVKLGEINERYARQRVSDTYEAYKEMYDAMLQNKPDDSELQIMASDLGFDANIKTIEYRVKDLYKLLNDENTKFTEEERAAMEEQIRAYEKTIEELYKAKNNAQIKIAREGNNAVEAVKAANEEMLKTIEDNKMLEIYKNKEVEKTRLLEEQAQRRLEAAQEEVTRLESLTEEQIGVLYVTQEQYELALNTAKNNVVLAQNEVAQAVRNTNQVIADQQMKLVDTFTTIANSTVSILGNFQTVFEALADSDDKYTKYAKAIAMTQILINTAVAIVSAIAAATESGASFGVLAPAMIPVFIAELVGIVSGAIASAVAVLKKADTPSKPKFAEGGLVGDQVTTRTDDSVEANLSVGEFVVRSAAVRSIGVGNLNRMNATGQIPTQIINNTSNNNVFDMEQMKEVFAEAVSEIHPVVSVREITSVQKSIEVKESIAKY